MQKEDIVIHRDLGDTAVDRAANSLARATQIEIDPCGVCPGLGTALQIVLSVKVLSQQTPFPLITHSLQQFELMKSGQRCFVAIELTIESGLDTTGAIAKNLDPYRRIDQNHSRNFLVVL